VGLAPGMKRTTASGTKTHPRRIPHSSNNGFFDAETSLISIIRTFSTLTTPNCLWVRLGSILPRLTTTLPSSGAAGSMWCSQLRICPPNIAEPWWRISNAERPPKFGPRPGKPIPALVRGTTSAAPCHFAAGWGLAKSARPLLYTYNPPGRRCTYRNNRAVKSLRHLRHMSR
jgi:hypothetical protein